MSKRTPNNEAICSFNTSKISVNMMWALAGDPAWRAAQDPWKPVSLCSDLLYMQMRSQQNIAAFLALHHKWPSVSNLASTSTNTLSFPISTNPSLNAALKATQISLPFHFHLKQSCSTDPEFLCCPFLTPHLLRCGSEVGGLGERERSVNCSNDYF